MSPSIFSGGQPLSVSTCDNLMIIFLTMSEKVLNYEQPLRLHSLFDTVLLL